MEWIIDFLFCFCLKLIQLWKTTAQFLGNNVLISQCLLYLGKCARYEMLNAFHWTSLIKMNEPYTCVLLIFRNGICTIYRSIQINKANRGDRVNLIRFGVPFVQIAVWVKIRLLPFMCEIENVSKSKSKSTRSYNIATYLCPRYAVHEKFEANFTPALQIESIFVFHFRL